MKKDTYVNVQTCYMCAMSMKISLWRGIIYKIFPLYMGMHKKWKNIQTKPLRAREEEEREKGIDRSKKL